ncbi:hypothetical protein EDC65_1780 [Stella humosa]|uniref:Uncharacterized protein n=1 Tax=Stella humosa TaxID=94 RepID=A0A3N1MFK2_9PROT|nr:hypothetical protein [Stella humosa]ROP99985.1 hypothetical protein EDC65_1780 [Stella humosa]BBK30784.1 hypothetical protein STHU_14180 [Stella humosa]
MFDFDVVTGPTHGTTQPAAAAEPQPAQRPAAAVTPIAPAILPRTPEQEGMSDARRAA